MNILLIGNGFDLAHYLPTKYSHFLEFIKVIKQIVQGVDSNNIDWGKTGETQIKEMIEVKMGNVENNIFSQKEMWKYLFFDNVWIEYFINNNTYKKENWIDFESEISTVIQLINEDMNRMGMDESKVVKKISESFFSKYFLDDIDSREGEKESENLQSLAGKISVGEQSEYKKIHMVEKPIERLKEEITYKQLITRLINDLNKLIRALEIYLVEYVNEIEINKSELFLKLKVDHVLSFNYTNIFEENYEDGSRIKYDYIHGKAIHESDIDNDHDKLIKYNNMVLGIDEYLKKRKNKDLKFIAFKKYYQRIHKQTGCKYKDWLDEIKKENNKNKEELHQIKKKLESNNLQARDRESLKKKQEILEMKPKDNLYIFGHSLDITDKDIIKELILCDNVITTIFYPDQEELGRKIANLVRVIGQKELIRRTGGDVATIKFVPQQEMIEKEEIEKDNT